MRPHTGGAQACQPVPLPACARAGCRRHGRRLARRRGYTPGTADELLDQLAERLCCEGDFPHEIGVFLGYPLADVIGFIQNRGKNFTACGYWKVYTDPTAAQAEFDRYKKCERIYARCYYNGTPIRRLTVAA